MFCWTSHLMVRKLDIKYYFLCFFFFLYSRDTPIQTLRVHLGDHDLTSDNETIHITRGVQQVFFHSHFHPFLLANDIALLRLDKPVPFSDRIRPVCLPDPCEYTSIGFFK